MKLEICLFLFAGLLLTASGLTPEECQPLVQPLSMLRGRVHMVMGYVDNDAFGAILKNTESSWVEIEEVEGRSDIVLMHELNRINGSCFGSKLNVTIQGDSATADCNNITSVFSMLPTCEGCMTFIVNSTVSNLEVFLKATNLDIDPGKKEIKGRSLYLMGRAESDRQHTSRYSPFSDADVEKFKQQASCFGFDREPDYRHDSKTVFCREEESTYLPIF
uniref:Uncharacterized protein n=1 Tax=Mola mola TaxID=94237 RepID=A0A3Q4BNS3_MOLML